MASSSSSPFDREMSVYTAKLAEEAELYEVMVEEMKLVAKKVGKLTNEEMKLLTTGYTHVTVSLRDSWSTLAKIEKLEELKGNEAKVERITAYRHKLETKITNICHDYLSVVNQHLRPPPGLIPFVFYLKKKADYYRYLAEIKTGPERQEAADKSLSAYKTARVNAMVEFHRADPIRLSLDLNLAVLYHVVLGKTERALQIATNAVNGAVPDNRLREEEYTESTKILRVLKENIEIWSSGSSEGTVCFVGDVAAIPTE